MSAPFDLSNALKTPPTPLAPGPAGRGGGGSGGKRGTGTRLDDIARPVFWAALIVCGLLLAYLLYGLYGGVWADPAWSSLKANLHQMHLYHDVQQSNIALAFTLLRPASLILAVALVIIGMGAEGGGYILMGAAAVLYFGLPLLTGQLYTTQGLRGTTATGDVLRGLQTVGLLLGVPGLIWTGVDLVRRFRAAMEAVDIQRVNLKYADASKARALGIKTPPKLSPIQRQNRTYRSLATALMIIEPLLVILNLGPIEGLVNTLLGSVEKITNRLSFDPNTHGIAALHDADSTLILWILLFVLNLVVLTQLLRLLEFVCFRRRA